MENLSSFEGDKYRSFIYGEEEKNTKWRNGAPPNYDLVNKLFEEGRTKIWPPGSLEERVQNLVKTWEMEMFNKLNFDEYKTVDPQKYRFSLNGTLHNLISNLPYYRTSLPEELRGYNPANETIDSAHVAFTTAFPRGFVLEVLEVYSGPPVITYKFRHWGFHEGPFKGHAPTGQMVELYGMSVFELDENSKIVRVEFFFDRGELLGGLMKGSFSDSSTSEMTTSCPFLRNTG